MRIGWAVWLFGGLVLNLSGAGFSGNTVPPPEWKVYSAAEMMRLENGVLRLRDTDAARETGLSRYFAVEPGKTYEVSVEAAAVPGKAWQGAFIQLRALPSNQLAGGMVECGEPGEWYETAYRLAMPPGTTRAQVFLYTHRAPTPELLVRDVTLREVTGEAFKTAKGEVPPVPRLKDLRAVTDLAGVTLQTPERYRRIAERVAVALAARTGRRPVIVSDTAQVSGDRIVFGNRDTNAVLDRLYREYFVYTDAHYPGSGGYELRTLHNPYGDGANVVILGGSDDAEVTAAAERLIARPESKLPPVIDVRLPQPAPETPKETRYWTRMVGGFPGYGWNALTWQLELFYRTGDRKYAREFIRLAFPDAAGIKELKAFNAESFWDFSRPLSTPYHYMGHYLILLWDLVEEQDAFSDAERLLVTRALAAQMACNDINTFYSPRPKRLKKPGNIGTRHDQWSANCLYFLARYFKRDYPHPVWDNALASVANCYSPLFRADSWIRGEGGIVGWYPSGTVTGTAAYLLATGQKPAKPGPYYTALDFFEAFWDGTDHAEVFQTAAPHAFRQAAELTGDGKYRYYAGRMKLPEKNSFPLGQSFDAARGTVREPRELCGRWLNVALPPQAAREFGIAGPDRELLLAASYRDTLDGGGDSLLFDLFNEEYRTAYQLNSLYRLRIDGVNYLAGFGNYLQNTRDGAATAHIPTVARWSGNGVVGDWVYHASRVPDMAYGEWERLLVLKKRRFAVIADRLTATADGTCNYLLHWQPARGVELRPRGSQLVFTRQGREFVIDGAGLTAGERCHKGTATLKKGESVWNFTAIGPEVRAFRLSERAALLELPERHLVFSGDWPPFGAGQLVLVGPETIFRDGRSEKTTAAQREALLALARPSAVAASSGQTLPEIAAKTQWQLPFVPAAWEAVSFKGRDAILAGEGDRTALFDADGKVLLELATPGGVRCLTLSGEKILVGTRDEHLYAFALDGRKLWTHRAECATPPENQKHFYWYKGAYPGVYAVMGAANGEIFTGGACTVERISGDGKVLARYEQFWGPATWLGEVRQLDGSGEILAVRTQSADSLIVWSVNSVTGRNRSNYLDNLPGFKNFPQFGSMKRNFVVIADVDGDGREEVIADAAGMYVWINRFDAAGKPQAQVNLGPQARLTGLAAGRDAVAAVNVLRQLLFFDGNLRARYCRDLPEKPLGVWLEGEVVVVGDVGGLRYFDRQGRALRRFAVPDARAIRPLAGGGFAVLDGTGKLFLVPPDGQEKNDQKATQNPKKGK